MTKSEFTARGTWLPKAGRTGGVSRLRQERGARGELSFRQRVQRLRFLRHVAFLGDVEASA
jgi:hypothetical protein